MEEFRPLIVDRLVLELLGDGQLHLEQFTSSSRRAGAVDLDAAGRALLIERYEAAMQAPAMLPTGEQTALRRVVLLQTQAIARVILGEQERYAGYTP